MVKPNIHSNGTAASELLRLNLAASDSLWETIGKLEQASPNARDFYLQGPDAFHTAVSEHTERLEHLKLVLAELQELAKHIVDASDR